MRVFILILSLGIWGCLQPKKTTVYQPNPSPTNDPVPDLEAKYASVKAQLQQSCLTAGCHANKNIVDLSNGAKLAASRSQARVSNGSMPPPQSGPGRSFDDAKKAKLLSFFN
jgi:hypothetical protein